MKLPDKVYDVLKWIVLVFLPALSTLYYGIAQVWGLPIYAEQVVGTISIIEVFLGALIGISTINYNRAKQEALEDGEKEYNGE